MTFQLKYSMYNLTHSRVAIKANYSDIQIIIMNSLTTFIYMNIKTIKSNTRKKEAG